MFQLALTAGQRGEKIGYAVGLLLVLVLFLFRTLAQAKPRPDTWTEPDDDKEAAQPAYKDGPPRFNG